MRLNNQRTANVLFVILFCIFFFTVMNIRTINNERYGVLYAQIEIVRSPFSVFDFPYIPDTVYFFGGRVPLEVYGVWEDIDEWIKFFTNAKNRWRINSYIGLVKEYSPVIDTIFREEGVPIDAKYVGTGESGFTPNATSSKGAVGWWQFIRSTALRNNLRVNISVDERRELISSTRAACRELVSLFNEFRKTFNKEESWWFALAAYNAGSGRVWKAIKTDGESSYFRLYSLPRETERYIPCMIALKLILENPERYGFVEGVTYSGPKMAVIEKYFPRFTTWKSFLSELRKAGYSISLKELVRANSHIRSKDGIPKGTFILRVPDRKDSK